MKTYILFFLFLLPIQTFAHLGAILGTVYDKGTKSVLVGANISILNANNQAATNDLGQFNFRNLTAATYLLEISFVGFKTQIINIAAKEDETINLPIYLESSQIQLREITVLSTKSIDQQLIGKIDINLRQINNSQEFLRMVPGLFIGQHAGGGKAEQIFLRGFDIDHGTDIQITSDGMPVNMVSHAHGQGYADMHFIIPELVRNIDFKKGTYQAAKGNFATAGWVDLSTKTALEKSTVKLEAGQFDTYRALGIFDLLGEKGKNSNQSAYIAADYNFSNNYFNHPQDFNRFNLFGKYHGHISKNAILTISASTFSSKWSASGQIPDRAVAKGQIGFFGAIDPNEGGQTSRSNLNIQLANTTPKNQLIKNQIYLSHYNFNLYSNFTFFLNDSINGDQIKQLENRNIIGYNVSLTDNKQIGNKNINSILGLTYRQDFTQNTELSHTKDQSIVLNRLKLGDINEINAGIYLDETIQFSERLLVNAGLRFDYFQHQYTDKLTNNKSNVSANILSPKFNISYTFNNRTHVYLNTGKGFHSNDTRVVVSNKGLKTLPAAYGSDLGLVFKPFPNLLINPAIWYLWLDQEFIYVGDAGVVEPSGQSRRYGLDLSARYQITKKIYLDLDYNTTKPRAVGEKESLNYLPLAPITTSTFGLSYLNKNGLNGSIRGRNMGNRPANENNSIVAKGYFVNDLNINFTKSTYNIGLSIQNLFNTKWKETQFATESRLKNEAQSVEEIHFTPGTPFFAKLSLSLFF